MLEKFVDL